jgi:hypothetical protein
MLAVSRPKRMFADTDAVRALGSANSAHATDLADVAATLSSLPDAAPMLGPVGARFLTALAEAAANESSAVTALSERLSMSKTTAYAAAAAYDDADRGSGARINGV